MHRRNSSAISELDYYTGNNSQADWEAPPPGTSTYNVPIRQQDRHPHDSAQSTPSMKTVVTPGTRKLDSTQHSRGSLPEIESSRNDWGSATGSPSEVRNSYGEGPDERPPLSTARSPASLSTSDSFRREHILARKESMTLPTVFQAIDEDDAAPGSSRDAGVVADRPQSYEEKVPQAPWRQKDSYGSDMGQSVLPPPAISSSPTSQQQSPATPSSFFTSLSHRNTQHNRPLSQPQRPKSVRISFGGIRFSF